MKDLRLDGVHLRDLMHLYPPDRGGHVAIAVHTDEGGTMLYLTKDKCRELANWLFAVIHT